MTWKAQFDYKPDGFDRHSSDPDPVQDGISLSPVLTTQALPGEKCRAARYVASNATDAADCAELLDMLGLTAHDGLAGRDGTSPGGVGA